jgi:hypothetical protein
LLCGLKTQVKLNLSAYLILPLILSYSEHDYRQYQLMKEHLQQFEQGNLKLDCLINVLDGLLEALINYDEAWKENFRSKVLNNNLINENK